MEDGDGEDGAIVSELPKAGGGPLGDEEKVACR